MNKKDLHNIKDTGFKTPNNYFDAIEDRIFSKLNAESKLSTIKESGYRVPDGYLDTVEDVVLSKVEPEESKVISLFTRTNLLYATSIAAALVLLFSVFIKDEEPIAIDSEMVELYLEEQNLSSYELAELLNEVELLDEDFNVIEEQINESELESYLLDNVNIEDIIEQ